MPRKLNNVRDTEHNHRTPLEQQLRAAAGFAVKFENSYCQNNASSRKMRAA